MLGPGHSAQCLGQAIPALGVRASTSLFASPGTILWTGTLSLCLTPSSRAPPHPLLLKTEGPMKEGKLSPTFWPIQGSGG